jgi:thioredoxin reductase (NADPH)
MPAYDVIVIGEGVSGLSAAHALAQSGLKVATLEAQLFGGLVININELDPGPSGRAVSGAEFASELAQANSELGIASIQEPATGIRASGAAKEVVTDSGAHQARAIVIASGARLKRLGVPGEAEFEGRGVSQCADCDGPMYQNEEVVVVGGGDSALQEALVLAQYCGKVHLVHRGSEFSARPHFVEHVAAESKISTIWNATVTAIGGGKMVQSASIRHADGRVEDLPCAGTFAYIGLTPNSEFLPQEIKRDEHGGVVTAADLSTSVKGVWAVGAVRSGHGGTLDDALDEGRRVAASIRNDLT